MAHILFLLNSNSNKSPSREIWLPAPLSAFSLPLPSAEPSSPIYRVQSSPVPRSPFAVWALLPDHCLLASEDSVSKHLGRFHEQKCRLLPPPPTQCPKSRGPPATCPELTANSTWRPTWIINLPPLPTPPLLGPQCSSQWKFQAFHRYWVKG